MKVKEMIHVGTKKLRKRIVNASLRELGRETSNVKFVEFYFVRRLANHCQVFF